jgi:hypothetical protein
VGCGGQSHGGQGAHGAPGGQAVQAGQAHTGQASPVPNEAVAVQISVLFGPAVQHSPGDPLAGV